MALGENKISLDKETMQINTMIANPVFLTEEPSYLSQTITFQFCVQEHSEEESC